MTATAKYRATTTDGFIMAEGSRSAAVAEDAKHYARSMREVMVLKRWDEDAGWTEVERSAVSG